MLVWNKEWPDTCPWVIELNLIFPFIYISMQYLYKYLLSPPFRITTNLSPICFCFYFFYFTYLVILGPFFLSDQESSLLSLLILWWCFLPPGSWWGSHNFLIFFTPCGNGPCNIGGGLGVVCGIIISLKSLEIAFGKPCCSGLTLLGDSLICSRCHFHNTHLVT